MLCEELLEQRSPEEDAVLVRDLGRPETAARMLTDPRSYHRWLTIFACLAFCLALPLWVLLRAGRGPMPTAPLPGVLLLGMAVSLIQFHPGARRGGRNGRLFAALAGLAAVFLLAGGLLGGLMAGAWPQWPLAWYGPVARWTLCLAGAAGGGAALAGLVLARLTDRRWSALYVLGLTGLILCVLVTAELFRLDGAQQSGWVRCLLLWGVVGGVGLAGTGVSLC